MLLLTNHTKRLKMSIAISFYDSFCECTRCKRLTSVYWRGLKDAYSEQLRDCSLVTLQMYRSFAVLLAQPQLISKNSIAKEIPATLYHGLARALRIISQPEVQEEAAKAPIHASRANHSVWSEFCKLLDMYEANRHSQRCVICDKDGFHNVCSGCGVTVYCSVECQKKDRKEHKIFCDENNKHFRPRLLEALKTHRGETS